MKKLDVRYCGWGEDWLLGTLADDGKALLFEYSPEALAQNIELKPPASAVFFVSNSTTKVVIYQASGLLA